MKKVVCLILSLLIATLSSCTENRRAVDIAIAFCNEYPIDSKVYSSSSLQGEDGYIDAEMLVLMFGISERPVEEFALVLYGKVSTVRELGVFVTKNSDERMEITELAMSRISFLSSFAEGEGFIKKYRDVTVYGFVDDASRAELLLDNLI